MRSEAIGESTVDSEHEQDDNPERELLPEDLPGDGLQGLAGFARDLLRVDRLLLGAFELFPLPPELAKGRLPYDTSRAAS